MAELTPEMQAAGIFLDAAGNPTMPDGSPVESRGAPAVNLGMGPPEPGGGPGLLEALGVPPQAREAFARGDQTWSDPTDGSFWGVNSVSEPTEAPHDVPLRYGADAGDAYLWQQGQDAQQAQRRAIDQQYVRQMSAPAGRGSGAGGPPGGGDASVLAAQQRPQQLAEWTDFSQQREAMGFDNPIMPDGHRRFFPVWSPIGMRIIDRMTAQERAMPGDPDYSGSGHGSGRAVGFQTAFTLPGWAGGYQMVGYPGDIQGWIPRGGSGV